MLSGTYHTRHYSTEKTDDKEPLYLSLLISAGTFMYAISTGAYKTIVELCHLELNNPVTSDGDLSEQLSALVQNYGLNRRKFEKTLIAVLNTEFSLVPQAYVTPGNSKVWVQFASGSAPDKKTLTHQLKDIAFCYTAGNDLQNYLEKTFVNASLRHSGAVSLALLFSQHSLADSDFFLNVHDGMIEVAARKNDRILYYNVFHCSTNEDILYYLLFSMEQLEIKPEEIKLSVASVRPVTDELMKNIKHYVRHVSLCVSEPGLILKGDASSLPQHYYFTLLNQHLCEL